VARDNSATSILEILNADLDQGATATLEPHGPDAERAVVTLVTAERVPRITTHKSLRARENALSADSVNTVQYQSSMF